MNNQSSWGLLKFQPRVAHCKPEFGFVVVVSQAGAREPTSSAVQPVGRFGTIEETADAAVMLARNGYITGQTLHVNGGMYMA